MCGIIGISSNKSVSASIINSLKKLEYRGYDSAGIATLVNGNINEVKCEGRVDVLEKDISKFNLKGDIGIGNIVGSNIMNILFVFMPSLIIVHLRNFEYHLSSINDANILYNDESIIILIFATLIFIALSFMKIKLSKWMAIILLFCYFSYIFRILL